MSILLKSVCEILLFVMEIASDYRTKATLWHSFLHELLID